MAYFCAKFYFSGLWQEIYVILIFLERIRNSGLNDVLYDSLNDRFCLTQSLTFCFSFSYAYGKVFSSLLPRLLIAFKIIFCYVFNSSIEIKKMYMHVEYDLLRKLSHAVLFVSFVMNNHYLLIGISLC